MSVPRRVLHVTEAPLGGVVSCMEELIRDQNARGLERLEVVTPEINVAALSDVGSPPPHFTVLRYRRGAPLSLLAIARTVVARARATRPDIIHVHSTIAGAVVRLCRPFLPAGSRIVYCPHGWAFSREGAGWKNRLIGGVERLLSSAADAIVCVSRSEDRAAREIGISAAKTVVIENGIGRRPAASGGAPEAAPARRHAGDRKVVIFAGRFDRQKGFDTFVETMRQLGDEATGLAIGRAIVSNVTLDDLPANIELLGWQPRTEVMVLFARADLLLMPSRWEGFPMVALEAMQAGLAVFATRVGGLPDMVVEGETGALFAPDDTDAIVARIRASDPATLRVQGEAGRARFERLYTADRMNDRVWALYGRLMEEAGHRGTGLRS